MVRRVRADRERQSMAIHNRHDFHALSALRSSDFRPAALGHDERCVDEAFFFVQCASIAKLVGNIRQHATQNLIAAPSLKAPMHSFVVRVALRQHVPWGEQETRPRRASIVTRSVTPELWFWVRDLDLNSRPTV